MGGTVDTGALITCIEDHHKVDGKVQKVIKDMEDAEWVVHVVGIIKDITRLYQGLAKEIATCLKDGDKISQALSAQFQVWAASLPSDGWTIMTALWKKGKPAYDPVIRAAREASKTKEYEAMGEAIGMLISFIFDPDATSA